MEDLPTNVRGSPAAPVADRHTSETRSPSASITSRSRGMRSGRTLFTGRNGPTRPHPPLGGRMAGVCRTGAVHPRWARRSSSGVPGPVVAVGGSAPLGMGTLYGVMVRAGPRYQGGFRKKASNPVLNRRSPLRWGGNKPTPAGRPKRGHRTVARGWRLAEPWCGESPMLGESLPRRVPSLQGDGRPARVGGLCY